MTNTNLLRTLVALLATLLAAPAALAEDENPEGSAVDGEKICFDSARIRNFDGLNDDFLFVQINSNEMYLLKTRSICFGLRNARVIAFKDSPRRICSDDNFIEVLVRDMGRTSSCRIEGLEPVDSKDQARAIVDEHVAAKRAAKDAAEN